jgi:hypothetical protein
MKNWTRVLLFALSIGMLASACAPAASSSAVTSPTATSNAAATIGTLTTGTWASLAADPAPGTVLMTPGSCGNFKWNVITATLVSATGTFSADCGGGLTLAGSATGTLNGTTANWGASGSVAGTPYLCNFIAAGTAALEAGGVRITYNATVCGTVITGSELISKRK